MPLRDATPVIDDRRYDDLSEELRTRIARYAPEWKPEAVWSDFNHSDPGIILAQTFAWLAEMMIYRMGQVPQLNYVKFLELLGVELREAQPALAEVSFTIRDGWTDAYVDLPVRTQLAASLDGMAPIVFETERPLRVLSAQLSSVQIDDGGSYRDATTANAQNDTSFFPFGESAVEGSCLVLGFGFPPGYPSPDAFPALDLDLALWVAEQARGRPIVECGLPASAVYAPAEIAWEFWSGAEWQSLRLRKDETLALTRSGHLTLRTPATGQMKRDYLGAYAEDPPGTPQPKPRLFWIRGRLARAQYELIPELIAIRTNTVAALAAETVRDEVLGGTDGQREQQWQLVNRPVVADSLKVEIDDGTGFTPWQIVQDFLGAGPSSTVLALNCTNGELRAGDGLSGDVPVANALNPDANVIAREYRFGGGERGNVGPHTITALLSPVEAIDRVTNWFAAVGGRDEETLTEAKMRARRMVRSRGRAVTAEDFELLAAEAANIKRAKVIPLHHPQFPGTKVPGAITVIVVPDAPRRVANPTPSQATLRTVCAYLDQRRLLTSELFVVAPEYQRVAVTVAILAKDDADAGEVRDAIEESLLDYFHPLRGGDDGQGWPFGDTIRYSKVYQRVFGVTGVDSIERLVIALDGEEQPECRDVPVREYALLQSQQHAVEVEYRFQTEVGA
jgi:predicted phage baseplate assembly protein